MSKTRIIIYSILGLLCIAIGRYTAPKQTVTQIKEVIVHQVITRIKRPDGTTETTITTDKDSKEKAVILTPHSKVNISALAGVDMTAKFDPVYGIGVTKEFIGPVTIGAFGMTNGVVGLSLGLNF